MIVMTQSAYCFPNMLAYVTCRIYTCTNKLEVNFTVEKDNPKVATIVDINPSIFSYECQ